MNGYIRKSRECDRGRDQFGNPPISLIAKGFDFSWMSLMSEACMQDILDIGKELDDQTVDDVICHAVTLTTGRLFRVYAFSAFAAGVEPSKLQGDKYVRGLGTTP